MKNSSLLSFSMFPNHADQTKFSYGSGYMLPEDLKYSLKKYLSNLIPDSLINFYQFAKYHRRFPSQVHLGMSDYIHYLKSSSSLSSYSSYVDKLLVKNRVANLIGEEHIIPTYWSGTQLTREIWEQLPTAFMIKANHGSGWNYLVAEKSNEDFYKVEKITSKWMRQNFYYLHRERAYLNIKPALMVEEYIGTFGQLATDYKFYCVAGKIVFIMVIIGRDSKQKDILYDRNWNKLEIEALNPNDESVERPACLEKMIEIAERLAKVFDFIRIDLYCLNDHIYFGEYTFTPAAGFIKFKPSSYDQEFGNILKLELGDPLAFLKK
jgi:hypothetical protein